VKGWTGFFFLKTAQKDFKAGTIEPKTYCIAHAVRSSEMQRARQDVVYSVAVRDRKHGRQPTNDSENGQKNQWELCNYFVSAAGDGIRRLATKNNEMESW
jgi:hypothetical protein